MQSEEAKDAKESIVTELPCGCVYEDKGWMLTRIKECDKHRERRTRKKPYRPKAECVRP